MEQDKVLFKENEEGKYFYIVKSGCLELLIDNTQKRIFKPWDCFGDLALLQKSKRTGTVRCLSNVDLLVLDGQVFQRLIKSVNQNTLTEKLSFINMIPMLKCLDNIQKTNLARLTELIKFEDNEKIISQGDFGESMYIIKTGIVSCRITKQNEVRRLFAKDFFGHNCIIIDCSRSLDVVAIGIAFCYKFSKAILKEALGDNYKEVILFGIFKECVKADRFFEGFFNEDSSYDKAFGLFDLKVYKNYDVVYESNFNLNENLESENNLNANFEVDVDVNTYVFNYNKSKSDNKIIDSDNYNRKIVVVIEGNIVNVL